MKKNIIFFARDYQSKFFLYLNSDLYNSLFVVLTKKEKKFIIKNGYHVVACFEEEFESLSSDLSFDDYLETSFFSDRFLGGVNNSKRRETLSKEINFWNNIFEKYKPVAVINEAIAIEISEVLYIEAKKRGVFYWAWMSSYFKDRCFFWLDNPFNTSLRKIIFEKSPSLLATNKSKEYLQNFVSREKGEIFYVANIKNRFNIAGFTKNIFHFFSALFKIAVLLRKKYYFKHYYSDFNAIKIKIVCYINSLLYNYNSLIEINKFELVFYPLHFEPEASIIYMSEYYEDQISLIRNISKCLKHNQVLVVKEHPLQPGYLLTKKYRNLKKTLSNVYYLPAELSTYSLIEKSEIVVTQTSSAGWEAILLNKPVFVFGNVVYDGYPNINKVKSFQDLKTLIRNKEYKIPNSYLTNKFIAQLWDYCLPGNPFPHPDLYSEKNLNNIRKAIIDKFHAVSSSKKN